MPASSRSGRAEPAFAGTVERPPPGSSDAPIANFSRPVSSCARRRYNLVFGYGLVLENCISTYSCLDTGSAERNSLQTVYGKPLRQAPTKYVDHFGAGRDSTWCSACEDGGTNRR